MNNEQPLRFVHLQKPGQKYKSEEHKAVRTHVRRAIVREKKSRDINQNIRIFTPADWPVRKTRRRAKTQDSSNGPTSTRKAQPLDKPQDNSKDPHDCVEPTEPDIENARQSIEDPEPLINTIDTTRDRGNMLDTMITTNPISCHPFTALASSVVDLPEHRLDHLFKSGELGQIIGLE